MTGHTALSWETPDPDRVRALLGCLGFRVGRAGRMTVPGLAVAAVRAAGLDRLRPAVGDQRGPAGRATAPATMLLAVGVATVDIEAAAAAFGQPHVRDLGNDGILGARVAVGGDPQLVLLEPMTEGRLAAALARHGEGPAALYLGVEPAALALIRDRLLALGERPRAGDGPFGGQLLASARQPWEPSVLLVPGLPAAAHTRADAWATIDP
jgi:hypothetical protein